MRQARLVGNNEEQPQPRRRRRRRPVARARGQRPTGRRRRPLAVRRRRTAAPQRGQSAPKYKPGDMPKPTITSDGIPKVLLENWGTITGLWAGMNLVDGDPMPFEEMKPKSSDPIKTETDSKQPSEADLARGSSDYDGQTVEKWRDSGHDREKTKQGVLKRQPGTRRMAHMPPPASQQDLPPEHYGEQEEQRTVEASTEDSTERDSLHKIQTAHKIATIKSSLQIIGEDKEWDHAYMLAERHSQEELDTKLADLEETTAAATKTAQAQVSNTQQFTPPRIRTGAPQAPVEPSQPEPVSEDFIFGA